MICALVLILAVPAEALGGQSGLVYDLADYISSWETVDGVEYVYYKFDYTTGYWLIHNNGTYTGIASDTGNSIVFQPGAGSYDSFDFYYYFMGGNYSSGIKYNYLDMSMILDQRVVSLSFKFDFTASWFRSPSGNISLEWKPMVKFYDENLTYLDVAEALTQISTTGGGTSGSVFSDTLEMVFDFVVPEGAVYSVPYLRFSFDSDNSVFTDDFAVSIIAQGDWNIYTAFENLDETDDHYQAVEDKLDDLINGSPEQNEAAGDAMDEMGNHKDQIGNAVDQLDQMLKPDPGDLSSGIELVVDTDSNAAYLGVLGRISNSTFVVSLMTICGGMWLCSYVLFGKRG